MEWDAFWQDFFYNKNVGLGFTYKFFKDNFEINSAKKV